MSQSLPETLVVEVHGEASATPNDRHLTWTRVLSAGLRRIANPGPAVFDGTPVLTASARFHRIDRYFAWTAPVQATVAFRVNLDQVVSIRVRRESMMPSQSFMRQRALNIFPRNEESDRPLDFMWLGVTAHLVFHLARDAILRFWDWFYVRYGGPMPPGPGSVAHALHRVARPVTGTIEIDIQEDERLHFEAVLATWEIFHASVVARLPPESYRMRENPGRRSDQISIGAVRGIPRPDALPVVREIVGVSRAPPLGASSRGGEGAALSRNIPALRGEVKLAIPPPVRKVPIRGRRVDPGRAPVGFFRYWLFRLRVRQLLSSLENRT